MLVPEATTTHATIQELLDMLFAMLSESKQWRVCGSVCTLSLQGDDFVKTFQRQRDTVEATDFYAIRVVAKEIRLVLPRISCLYTNIIAFQGVYRVNWQIGAIVQEDAAVFFFKVSYKFRCKTTRPKERKYFHSHCCENA
jgi:hypothetical protein